MHFIRHGQSHFNLAFYETGRDPGIRDAPLTPEGVAQARRAGRHLADKGIEKIISSPYTRALQTASAIAEETGASVHVEPLVGELSIYVCDIGTPAAVLREAWAGVDFSHLADDQWWPESGETHDALVRRVEAFRDKWSAVLAEGGHALVSHWYFLNALTGHDFENGQVVFSPIFSGKRKASP